MRVAIEGIDGSGKTTVIEEVQRQVQEIRGETWECIDFPDYESPVGVHIGRILDQHIVVDPAAMATLFATDRLTKRRLLMRPASPVTLLNRYTPSNVAHQASVLENEYERIKLAQYITTLEYDVFQLPPPDLVIYLRIPVEMALENVAKKARRIYTDRAFDLHENAGRLTAAADVYEQMEMYHPFGTYVKLNTVVNGALLDVTSIAKQVVTCIENH